MEKKLRRSSEHEQILKVLEENEKESMAFDSDIEQALKTNREPPDELKEIEE